MKIADTSFKDLVLFWSARKLEWALLECSLWTVLECSLEFNQRQDLFLSVFLNPFIQHLASIYTIKKPGPFGISVSCCNTINISCGEAYEPIGVFARNEFCQIAACLLIVFLKKCFFFSLSFFCFVCLFVVTLLCFGAGCKISF